MLSLWIVWGIFLVLSALLSLVTANLGAVILLTVLFALPIVSALICLLFTPRLNVESIQPDSCEKNQSVIVKLSIVNSLNFSYRRIKADVLLENLLTNEHSRQVLQSSLYAKDKAMFELRIKSKNCGTVRISFGEITVYDFLGFFRKRIKVDFLFYITVLPEISPVDFSLQDNYIEAVQSDSYADGKSGTDLSEIYDFRDYAVGDAVNQIVWKLSQKYGRLIVKQGSCTAENSLLLALCFDKNQTYDERSSACERAISLCQSLCENNIRYKVIFYNGIKDSTDEIEVCCEEDLYAAMQSLLSAKCASVHTLLDDECNENIVELN